jgi:hypothetical protein
MPDKLAADSAIIAYHNILRLQAWIGNISLVVEHDLFGQTPLDQIHGPTVGEKLSEELRRLELQIFPLLDRAHRMLIRSLNFLERRGSGRARPLSTWVARLKSTWRVWLQIRTPLQAGCQATPLNELRAPLIDLPAAPVPSCEA